VVEGQTAAAESCEIYVSNIPATDAVSKLMSIFVSKRVTGIADCSVAAVTYDSNDSSCAIVKFTDHGGSFDDKNEYLLYFIAQKGISSLKN